MALPKEPRQKMINLMYLVLTALLALNVSAEILNAFKTVNTSLEKTNVLINNSTDVYLKSLEKKLGEQESHDRAVIWQPLAVKAHTISNEVYLKIQSLKDSLLLLSEFNPAKNGDSSYKEDDINTPERVIVEGGAGKKLYDELNNYKLSILGLHPAIAAEFAGSFPLDLSMPKSLNKASNTWEGAYFHMTPTIAALTILSKFQNDIRNTENKVVELCHKNVGLVENVFDSYTPIIAQSATYVMNGQEVEVSAGLGAFNSKNLPTITIDGSSLPASTGLVSKKFTASGVGSHTVHVVINYKDQNNRPQTLAKDITYTVGQPTGVSVSADAVKVLYIGLQNPMSVSAGAVGSEKVSVSTDNGNIQRGDKAGSWIAQPAKPGSANITVTADGKSTPFTFRVKSVPNPVAKIGENGGGRMKVNDFRAQFGVRAELENFIFEGVKFTVNSYTIIFTGAGFPNPKVLPVQGDAFDDAVKAILDSQIKPGTTIAIDDIKASGAGSSRTLAPIVFNLTN